MNAWLTRLTLDVHNRRIRKMLADGPSQHRYLMRLVADDLGDQPRHTAGLLYRIENIDTTATVLVQSTTPPLVEHLATDGLLTSQIRPLAPLLDGIDVGRSIKYRIVANPTKRWGNSAPDPRQRGKLHVLRGPQAEEWWAKRAHDNGLDIQSAQWGPRPDVPVNRGQHATAQFDGLATIRDAAAVHEAILTGIGRARSYGCGMLSIAFTTGHAYG